MQSASERAKPGKAQARDAAAESGVAQRKPNRCANGDRQLGRPGRRAIAAARWLTGRTGRTGLPGQARDLHRCHGSWRRRPNGGIEPQSCQDPCPTKSPKARRYPGPCAGAGHVVLPVGVSCRAYFELGNRVADERRDSPSPMGCPTGRNGQLRGWGIVSALCRWHIRPSKTRRPFHRSRRASCRTGPRPFPCCPSRPTERALPAQSFFADLPWPGDALERLRTALR